MERPKPAFARHDSQRSSYNFSRVSNESYRQKNKELSPMNSIDNNGFLATPNRRIGRTNTKSSFAPKDEEDEASSATNGKAHEWLQLRYSDDGLIRSAGSTRLEDILGHKVDDSPNNKFSISATGASERKNNGKPVVSQNKLALQLCVSKVS